MRRFLERGDSNAEGIAILAVLIVIALVGMRGGSNRSASEPNATSTPPRAGIVSSSPRPGGTTSPSANIVSTSSSYTRSVSFNLGNARNSYQPLQEYVTIRNSGREPIDITGWQLKNGMDNRTYYLNGSLQRFPSDVAFIGQATTFLSPTGSNQMRNVVLAPGETAIITTGRSGSQLPYPIVSFKENMCTGYLQNMPEYSFTPSLTRNCPRPANEIGLEWLDTECRTFVSRLPSCQTPDFTQRDRRNEPCNNCVNRTPLSGACIAFIKERFSYQGCVAHHGHLENFSGRTWRIFLGRNWEMWGREYETVSLFDVYGRLVAERKY